MRFYIKLSDKIIEINSIYQDVYEMCRDYLYTPTDDNIGKPCDVRKIDGSSYSCEPDIIVTTVQADIEFERSRNSDEEHVTDGYLETLAVYRSIAEQMLSFDTILMHGSVVAVGEEAYMFTAASGVGKTTRTRWWLEQVPGAYIINGDKPLLHITDNGVMACGTPWSGKEKLNTNKTVPLRAIIVLDRSEEDQNGNTGNCSFCTGGTEDNEKGSLSCDIEYNEESLQKITFLEAFAMLLQQTYRPELPALMSKTLGLLKKLGQNVTIYRYRCSLDDTDMVRVYEVVTEKARL